MSEARIVLVTVHVEDDKHCASKCVNIHRDHATGRCGVFEQEMFFDPTARSWWRCKRCLRQERKGI